MIMQKVFSFYGVHSNHHHHHHRRFCAGVSVRHMSQYCQDCVRKNLLPRMLCETGNAGCSIPVCRPVIIHCYAVPVLQCFIQNVCSTTALYCVQRMFCTWIIQYPNPDGAAVEVGRCLINVQHLGLRIVDVILAAGVPMDTPVCAMLCAVPEKSISPCRVMRSAIILKSMQYA